VTLLLKNGATIDALCVRGRTALHLAVVEGHEGVVNVLLLHGADVNIVDLIEGMTPLELAAEKWHWPIFNLLKQHGGTTANQARLRQISRGMDEAKKRRRTTPMSTNAVAPIKTPINLGVPLGMNSDDDTRATTTTTTTTTTAGPIPKFASIIKEDKGTQTDTEIPPAVCVATMSTENVIIPPLMTMDAATQSDSLFEEDIKEEEEKVGGSDDNASSTASDAPPHPPPSTSFLGGVVDFFRGMAHAIVSIFWPSRK